MTWKWIEVKMKLVWNEMISKHNKLQTRWILKVIILKWNKFQLKWNSNEMNSKQNELVRNTIWK